MKAFTKVNVIREFKFILYKATSDIFYLTFIRPIWNMLTSYGIIRHCSNCSN